MTAAMTTASAVVVLLLGGALAGPRMLDRLAPWLAQRPRLGISAWVGAVVVWLLGLSVLGPLLAWVVTGPGLPGDVGAICRRCLEAANPFGIAAVPTGVPPLALLALPALLLLAVAVAVALSFHRAERERTAQVAALHETGEIRLVAGSPVWLVASPVPTAYCLPGREAGIVISEGAVGALDEAQLGAVLAHERAHLRGRHHLLLGLLRAASRVLAWVPLVAAAPRAVAGYAEMTADDAAHRAHGTRALAGALLALRGSGGATPATALHAGAYRVPSRVQRLVAPPAATDVVAVTVAGSYLIAVAGTVLLVAGPYLAVLLRGTC
ncbi:M56 family metallopeptidase [Georgenia sp. MJ170]|uniref:M56 family metallopeptidase n=1 Tax=Georgenia sunbinii TaxID=3117728 RepID=UPI002F2644FC